MAAKGRRNTSSARYLSSRKPGTSKWIYRAPAVDYAHYDIIKTLTIATLPCGQNVQPGHGLEVSRITWSQLLPVRSDTQSVNAEHPQQRALGVRINTVNGGSDSRGTKFEDGLRLMTWAKRNPTTVVDARNGLASEERSRRTLDFSIFRFRSLATAMPS